MRAAPPNSQLSFLPEYSKDNHQFATAVRLAGPPSSLHIARMGPVFPHSTELPGQVQFLFSDLM